MIDYNPKSWIQLIFGLYSRYVLRQLLPLLFFVGVISSVLCFVVLEVFRLQYQGNMMVHSILGVVLGLFLVLRTNTAYDRWWEGRKLWGQLVNDTRHLAIKLSTLLPKDSEHRGFFQEMISNIPFAMKEHLRDSILVGELHFSKIEWQERIIRSSHRPNQLVQMMWERLLILRKEQLLSAEELIILDKELKGFTDIVGACERIKSTPIPHSYSMFIKKFLFFYTITLPLSLVWEYGYWTAIIVVVAFYFLVSVELIAEEIEEPFGGDMNDLPLQRISERIRLNIAEIFSEQN